MKFMKKSNLLACALVAATATSYAVADDGRRHLLRAVPGELAVGADHHAVQQPADDRAALRARLRHRQPDPG